MESGHPGRDINTRTVAYVDLNKAKTERSAAGFGAKQRKCADQRIDGFKSTSTLNIWCVCFWNCVA